MRPLAVVPLCLLGLLARPARARPPRPHLTPAAAALLQSGAAFLAPDDNLLIPLDGGRPVAFLEPAAGHLELAASAALLVIDGDLYRWKEHRLARVVSSVGAMPVATPEPSLVASIEDKRTLKLQRGDESKRVPYHREGRYELEHPYLTPDGRAVLVAVRDYTQPLDAYDFLVVDVATLALEEIHLSKRFAPGPLRQTLSPDEVALQMFTQRGDADGRVTLEETDFVVFDRRTRTLKPAPPTLLPGAASPSGRYSLLPGPMTYSDDKRCGGDETRLYEAGKPRPSHLALPGAVVSLLDFLPDERGVVANVLTLKGCHNRGVVIPLGVEVKPSEWKPFALPTRDGRLTGRVVGGQ